MTISTFAELRQRIAEKDKPMKRITLAQADYMRHKLDRIPREVYAVPDKYAGVWRLSHRSRPGARMCGMYTSAISTADLLADANEVIGA